MYKDIKIYSTLIIYFNILETNIKRVKRDFFIHFN